MYGEEKKATSDSQDLSAKESMGDKAYMKAQGMYESLKGFLEQSGVPMDKFMKECGQETDERAEFSNTEEDEAPADDSKKMAIIMSLKKKNAMMGED